MSLRKALTIHKRYSILGVFLSASFMFIKNIIQRGTQLFYYPKFIILKGNARIGIHHLTKLTLKNSKIIVERGTFKVGIDYGYYDGGGFDSRRDVCRIHLVNSTLTINGNVSLYPGVQILANNAEISIGNGTKINGPSQFVAMNKIEIGEGCFVAQGVIVRDNDGHRLSYDGNPPDIECLPVKIGNHCWLGQRSMVLKGAALSDNVVVAAGAVVTRDADQGALVAGIPAKVIANNISWSE